MGGGIPCLVVPHWLNLKEFNFSYLVYCLRFNWEDGTCVGLWEFFFTHMQARAKPGPVKCSVRGCACASIIGYPWFRSKPYLIISISLFSPHLMQVWFNFTALALYLIGCGIGSEGMVLRSIRLASLGSFFSFLKWLPSSFLLLLFEMTHSPIFLVSSVQIYEQIRMLLVY